MKEKKREGEEEEEDGMRRRETSKSQSGMVWYLFTFFNSETMTTLGNQRRKRALIGCLESLDIPKTLHHSGLVQTSHHLLRLQREDVAAVEYMREAVVHPSNESKSRKTSLKYSTSGCKLLEEDDDEEMKDEDEMEEDGWTVHYCPYNKENE